MTRLKIIPITIKTANEFVKNHHRHSKPTVGGRFAIAATFDDQIVGVAIVGRPVSPAIDQNKTAEVTRLCVLPDAPRNTCSFLYGRCWRIWQQMGGHTMLTYTLKEETGASLRGAGWQQVSEVKPSSWNRPSRARKHQPVYDKPKWKWTRTDMENQ